MRIVDAARARSLPPTALRLLTLSVLLVVLLVPHLAIAADFGARVPGQHVYDRAGILTASEVADLERRAVAVESAGAPTIIYLRLQNASAAGTQNDAANLMSAWDLQSAPGARDGLVIFLNLNPTDPRHGQVAIYVGERLKNGNLPQYEINRIVNQVILPPLRQGQLAGGIGAGLDAASHSLIAGPTPPPPPSVFQRFARWIAAGPFSLVNVVSVIVAALAVAVAVRAFRAGPRRRGTVAPTTVPPGSRPPAEVGALVRGRVGLALVEGTILDLARRGALDVEPAGERRIRLRLVDGNVVETGYERATWEMLSGAADRDGIVNSDAFRRLAGKWSAVQDSLRTDLERQGLFDPAVGRRRRTVFEAGSVALAVGLGVFVFCAIGTQPYGAIGGSLLLGAGTIGLVLGALIPDTTDAGESEAGPWRDYEAGIKAARGDRAAVLDLDQVVPYAAALGVVGSLDRRLREASAAGYAPTWLGHALSGNWDGGFYPYWVAFHGTVAPVSGGGASAGGAAAGGAGASGSF